MDKNVEQYKLWDEFLKEWPASRLKDMTLEEYNQSGDFNTFCNWIETRTEKLGSIWGGAAFKFGIYNRKDKSNKQSAGRYIYTEDYAWEAIFGNTLEEAFNNVKNNILSIIDAVQSSQLERIEDVKLWPVTRWKIAFLYQDRVNPILVNVFRSRNLKEYLGIDGKEDIKSSSLYRQIMEKREGKDILEFGGNIWASTESTIEALKTTHVLKAISEFDNREIKSDERSSTYDLIYYAKRFPPKLIYSLAHKYLSGEELDRSTFDGGENTRCFKDLRSLGFAIERKDFVPEILKKFIKQGKEGKDLTHKQYKSKFCGLDVKASFGQTNFTHIPWISFTGYDQTTSNGIYPVYLYYRSIDILILAYGISETNISSKTWSNINSKETISDYLEREFNQKPERYGDSYVHSVYKIPLDFNNHQLTTDLDQLIDEYIKLILYAPNLLN